MKILRELLATGQLYTKRFIGIFSSTEADTLFLKVSEICHSSLVLFSFHAFCFAGSQILNLLHEFPDSFKPKYPMLLMSTDSISPAFLHVPWHFKGIISNHWPFNVSQEESFVLEGLWGNSLQPKQYTVILNGGSEHFLVLGSRPPPRKEERDDACQEDKRKKCCEYSLYIYIMFCIGFCTP